MNTDPSMLTRTAVASEIERLANVKAGSLVPLLLAAWSEGDELVAAQRIKDLERVFVRRAAAARQRQAKRPHQNIREVIDELVNSGRCRTRTAAFRLVADQQRRDEKTIRNAYYKASQDHEGVITAS